MPSNQEEDLGLDDMFPEDRPPSPEPTFAVYRRTDCEAREWKVIKIRLVGSHPLWGHYLWNAARSFASYLDAHPEFYAGRSVLELGAGGGLPGIVTAKNAASLVVLTDYPDSVLIDNLEHNVKENVSPSDQQHVSVAGYIWGHSVKPLTDLLPHSETAYDLIILSDLIFNHSQHEALLDTCESALARSHAGEANVVGDAPGYSPPAVLVFYTHHRPHLAHKDLQFFDLARSRSWTCVKVLTETFPPMFPDDPGEESVRSTVHGWKLTRQ
ncbi:hypothetical protein BDN72DRAFT_841219 [Pluteus cervinus]|uniref:Uncharacterized protein n=1 Tax=Pluteus cervinus TaxID=181527 RepID=A0ACD3AVD0_9AGAR|nr:hypothetical protein BDN72DRAFT_841219 [Pluteus cervinus]